MFTFGGLLELRKKLNCEYCDQLTEELFELIYHKQPEEYLCIEEWEDVLEEREAIKTPYINFLLSEINNDLQKNGVCFIQLANSTGEDKTFIHIFALFLTIDREVIRMEAYGRQRPLLLNYETRLVEWPTYQIDLEKLLSYSLDRRLLEWVV